MLPKVKQTKSDQKEVINGNMSKERRGEITKKVLIITTLKFFHELTHALQGRIQGSMHELIDHFSSLFFHFCRNFGYHMVIKVIQFMRKKVWPTTNPNHQIE